MESDLKTTLLRSIRKIYEGAENCQLSKSAFQAVDPELETINNYFMVTKKQAFSIEDCTYLAIQFDFSGGQIDNIVRKSEMNEVINGNLVTLKEVIDFCRVEQFSNNERVIIGYSKN